MSDQSRNCKLGAIEAQIRNIKRIKMLLLIVSALVTSLSLLAAFIFACDSLEYKLEAKLTPPLATISKVCRHLIHHDELSCAAKKDGDWAVLAGSFASIACGCGALATLFFIYLDGRIQAMLNLHAAKINAQTAKLNDARARVQTLWKGSDLEFTQQRFDTNEFERIKNELLDGVTDEKHRELIEEAVNRWKHSGDKLQGLLDELAE